MPLPFASPERRLYELLSSEHGDAAYSRYNALVRRLVSFERTAGTTGALHASHRGTSTLMQAERRPEGRRSRR